MIQVEFEGRNPMTSDFHGIRQLLHQLFLKSDINLSELADIVTGNENTKCAPKIRAPRNYNILRFFPQVDVTEKNESLTGIAIACCELWWDRDW